MNNEGHFVNILKDNRVGCYSAIINMQVENYIELVKDAYKSRGGGLEGQREALKTKTAIRIRERMKEDIIKGAILPPIVIGMVLPHDKINIISNLNQNDSKKLIEIIHSVSKDNVSIIDGMQRTTAILDALDHNSDVLSRTLRVEFWLASNINSLIYRMLILNTGQVPWNLRRQIEVVFNSMIEEIKVKVPSINLIELGQNRIRSQAGDFQADQLVELFLVFGARKEKIDTKERLADEFTRLDFVEATSENEFINIFYGVLDLLGVFDTAIFNYKLQEIEDDEEPIERKFTKGKDLLNSQTARVGFVTSLAIEILGRPGVERTNEQQLKNWEYINNKFRKLIHKVSDMNETELGDFLDLMTLNQSIARKSGKIGDFEREFFTKAFKVLIEEDFELASLTPCWRGY